MTKEYKIVTNTTEDAINDLAADGWESQQVILIPIQEQNPLNPNQGTLRFMINCVMVRDRAIDFTNVQ